MSIMHFQSVIGSRSLLEAVLTSVVIGPVQLEGYRLADGSGSLVPDEYGGRQITEIVTESAANTLDIVIDGEALGAGFWTSIDFTDHSSLPDASFLSADASYSSGSGVSRWTFSGSTFELSIGNWNILIK